jgi:PadR family transcriptional regulator, regulatory protein PadR
MILKGVKLLNKEMLKGIIDLLILSLLNEKDSYGYEISKAIKQRTEGAFALQEPTLYLSLKRLEKRGMVSSYWGEESRGGRRKYYSITEEGRKMLQGQIRDWKQLVEIVARFL